MPMPFFENFILTLTQSQLRHFIDNMLISRNKKISSGVKNYERFIGYMDDNYKIKLLCIILPKRSTYVKSHGGEAI